MTQYSTLRVKLSNSQLNELKSRIKNETQITLNLSSNLTRNSNDETNFPHKSLLRLKFQGFAKLLQMVHQLTKNFQILKCLRGYRQEES